MNRQHNLLILEDEQRAGEKLLDLIREAESQADVHWLRSTAEGIDFLKNGAAPDLIFADVELLDGNVFRVFEAVRPACPVIFCTAYDAFYAAAFQANGIAYLLKPYSPAQFRDAWEKYLRLFGKSPEWSLPATFWETIQSLAQKEKPAYKTTFPVKKRDGVFLLKTKDIACFQAQSDFVFAMDRQGGKHILNYSLAAVEALLDPVQFFRINRSEIVQFDSILKYAPFSKNKLAITLSQPPVVLYTASSRTAAFRGWAENR